ncbi:MAG: metal ABC transporter permease [Gammaproteobacteria bacterium]|nr:metal ABC transporter permease [Gammaproteobacteria bacterium]
MTEFFSALASHGFLQSALAAGLLASVGCGIMGTYVVVKRIGFLAGGIAHTVLGGMGAALYYGHDPMLGALLAAVASALVIGWITLRFREHEDTLISALWAVGMAVGVLFLARTPGYGVDLMSYLFGNILLVPREDLWLMAALDAVLVGTVLALYRPLLAVAFDEEFARLRGLPVTFLYLLLLCLVALTVVLLIRVVGLILVIALLTLPAAIATQYAATLGRMMVLAVALGAALTSTGLALSYAPDLPAGPTIIVLAGGAYLLSTLARQLLPRGSG